MMATGLVGQEATPAQLGVLLDVSAEMGFLVPQVRKELRILNRQLAEVGRPPVIVKEMEGASLDQEASTAVGARRNVLYRLKALYETADTVLWITSLRGEQSPRGIFAVETLLGETPEERPARQLLIRNVWQDQVLAGPSWLIRPPSLNSDPLDLRNRPEEWYRLVGVGGGLILRSWQLPPQDLRGSFGFPYRIGSRDYLKRAGYESAEAFFDQKWSQELTARHGLRFQREKEEWPGSFTGRRWFLDSTLLPFPDEDKRVQRNAEVLEDMCGRQSIELDLSSIESEKLGVVFGIGYVDRDLKHFQALKDKPVRSWRDWYLADLARIGSECANHIAAAKLADPNSTHRIYSTEAVAIDTKGQKPEVPGPVIRRVAEMAREERTDAIYLFTNGYFGGGDYGTWSLDFPLLALAIREAGTRLYVRIPFEFGAVPTELARLAMASGGGVFRGRISDPDWEMPLAPPAWPEVPVAEP